MTNMYSLYRYSYTYLLIKQDSDIVILDNHICKLTVKDVSGYFQYRKYPKTINLTFNGWEPILWEDDLWIYIIGLPGELNIGQEITVTNEDTKEVRKFTHHDKYINWKHFFSCFVEHTFHDDLD